MLGVGDGGESWKMKQAPQQQDGRAATKETVAKDKEGGKLESLLSDITGKEPHSGPKSTVPFTIHKGDECHTSCTFPGEGVNVLERSLVSDYEGKLHKKKEEVAELLKEREELRATHKRLLALQKKMHFRQV